MTVNIRRGDKVWIKSPIGWDDKWHKMGIITCDGPTIYPKDNPERNNDAWLVRPVGDYGSIWLREQDFQVLMN